MEDAEASVPKPLHPRRLLATHLTGCLSGSAEGVATLAAQVHRDTGGIALFVAQTIRESGGEPDGAAGLLPAGTRAVLHAQLRGLPGDTLRTLTFAAADGQRIDVEGLAHIQGVDASTIIRQMAPAVRSGLVTDESDNVLRYAFRHALVRRAVYDDLLPGERMATHHVWATTLIGLRTSMLGRAVPSVAICKRLGACRTTTSLSTGRFGRPMRRQ